MTWDWIIIEAFAILIEIFACIYFLYHRHKPKTTSMKPHLSAWLIIVTFGLLGTFGVMPQAVYDAGTLVLFFAYVIIVYKDPIMQKLLGVLFMFAIFVATAVTGAGVAALLTNVSPQQTFEMQDTSRMLMILFVKMLQVIVFYLLAKKHAPFQALRRRPLWILFGAVLLNSLCLVFVWIIAYTPNLNELQNHALTWVAVTSLALMIAIFVMYEMFISEEKQNIILQTEVQRLELQSHFYQEIDTMYSSMREWRHDYKNNLIALRALVEASEQENALHYKIPSRVNQTATKLHYKRVIWCWMP
jgi:hypothetical protein